MKNIENNDEKDRQSAKEEAVKLALQQGIGLMRRDLEIHGMKIDGSTRFISRSIDYEHLWEDAQNALADSVSPTTNVIIFHGSSSTPNSFWYPWLKSELEKRGYSVFVPQLPDANVPDMQKWLPYALENGTFTNDTILIGHSSGGPLILGILEKINVKIKQAILVAGFGYQIDKKNPQLIIPKRFNWKKIRSCVNDIIFINSDNDPWGCDDKQGRKMLNKLGGKLIIPLGEGHMGSDKFKQPYKEFPFLLKLVD